MAKEITVSREEFLEILKRVKAGIPSKETIPQSTHFIFDDTRIYAYNSATGVSSEYITGVKCAVPATPLLSFVNNARNDSIILSFSDGELSLVAGKAKAKIVTDNEIHFPFNEAITVPEKLVKLGIPSNILDNAVNMVLFTVCNDTQAAQLCCVHIAQDSKGTFVETTDRASATRVYVSDKCGELNIKIPSDVVKSLVSLKPLRVGVADGRIYFECKEKTVFASNYPIEEFPDISSFENYGNEKKTKVVFPDKIVSILESAVDFSVDRIAQDSTVAISISEGKARISTKGAFGSYKEVCKVECDGDVRMVINPFRLLEIFALGKTLYIGKSTVTVKGELNDMPFWHCSGLYADTATETEE